MKLACRCIYSASGCTLKGCPNPKIHPRQAEILKNNYRLFMDRAYRARDYDYKNECIKNAASAAIQYQIITGKEVSDDT